MFALRRIALAVALAGLAAGSLAAEDEANEAQLAQYVQLLQPVLWRELEFVRQTCDPTPEQRPRIKQAADAAVRTAAKSIFAPQRRGSPATAAQIIRDNVFEAVKGILPPEQFAPFADESKKRDEAIRDATLLAVVAQLDSALYLNAEQRELILSALKKDWKRDWEYWLEMQRYAGQYYPQVPDQYVVPHLTADQQTIWRSLNKVMVWGWHNEARQPADEAWWSGKEASDQAQPDVQRPAKPARLIKPVKN